MCLLYIWDGCVCVCLCVKTKKKQKKNSAFRKSDRFAPSYYYYDPNSNISLCPVHAKVGSCGQSSLFINEAKVLLDVINSYIALIHEKDSNTLENVWADSVGFENDTVLNPEQFATLCRQLVKLQQKQKKIKFLMFVHNFFFLRPQKRMTKMKTKKIKIGAFLKKKIDSQKNMAT